MLIPMEVFAALTPYAVLSDDNTVLTFYYDENKDSRGGMGVVRFQRSTKQGLDYILTLDGILSEKALPLLFSTTRLHRVMILPVLAIGLTDAKTW